VLRSGFLHEINCRLCSTPLLSAILFLPISYRPPRIGGSISCLCRYRSEGLHSINYPGIPFPSTPQFNHRRENPQTWLRRRLLPFSIPLVILIFPPKILTNFCRNLIFFFLSARSADWLSEHNTGLCFPPFFACPHLPEFNCVPQPELSGLGKITFSSGNVLLINFVSLSFVRFLVNTRIVSQPPDRPALPFFILRQESPTHRTSAIAVFIKHLPPNVFSSFSPLFIH